MSDADTEIRRFIAECTYDESKEAVGIALLTAALSSARADALEEAATEMDGLAASAKVEGDDDGADAYEVGAEYLRALISTPPPASIPVEKVREMFREALEYSWLRPAQATALARILGVDLDAKGDSHE